MEKKVRKKDCCTVCGKKSDKKSFSFEDTYWCDFCKDYFGKESKVANGTNLIRQGEY